MRLTQSGLLDFCSGSRTGVGHGSAVCWSSAWLLSSCDVVLRTPSTWCQPPPVLCSLQAYQA